MPYRVAIDLLDIAISATFALLALPAGVHVAGLMGLASQDAIDVVEGFASGNPWIITGLFAMGTIGIWRYYESKLSKERKEREIRESAYRAEVKSLRDDMDRLRAEQVQKLEAQTAAMQSRLDQMTAQLQAERRRLDG